MRCVSQAVAVAGLTDHRHAGSSGAAFLPQAPGREVEGVDEQRQPARRHQHVAGSGTRLLWPARGLAVGRKRGRQRLAPWRVGRACRCRRRCPPPSRSSPCRCWRWRWRSRSSRPACSTGRRRPASRRALAVGHRAQRGAAGFACEGEAGAQVEPGRVDRTSSSPSTGSNSACRAGAGDPAAAEVVVQQFAHRARLR